MYNIINDIIMLVAHLIKISFIAFFTLRSIFAQWPGKKYII